MQIYDNVAGHKPSAQMLIVLCGVAKLYIGEITETGKHAVVGGWSDTLPILCISSALLYLCRRK